MTAISAATNSDPAHVRVVSVRLVDARVHVHTRVNIDNAAAGQCAHTHMCTHARTHEYTHVRVPACIVHTSVRARTHTHKHTHTHIHIRSQHFLPPACARGSERQRRRGCKHGGNTPPAPVDREHTRRTQQARSGGRVPGVQHWRLKLCYLYRAVIMLVLASG